MRWRVPRRGAMKFGACAALLLICLATLMTARRASSNALAFFDDYYLGTGQASAGDPVDIATGGYGVQEQLAYLPGRVPVSLSWKFQSHDLTDGPLGVGTSLSCDWKLQFTEPGAFSIQHLEVVAPGGKHFVFDGDTTLNSWRFNLRDPEMLGASLMRTGPQPLEQGGVLKFKSGTKFTFEPSGWLQKIEDRHGNGIQIIREPVHLYPAYIYDLADSTRVITLTYWKDEAPLPPATHKLKSVGVEGHTTGWNFSYAAVGSFAYTLKYVDDPMGKRTTYNWTTKASGSTTIPLISNIKDRAGYTRVDNRYDALGRVY
jgi:hypothetical protein